MQARSAASVDAILEATLQVLVQSGKERLTTTAVARRAGVSVGTLYQYFPNKASLLQATLRQHFDGVVTALLAACEGQQGRTTGEMAEAMAEAFLAAKLRDGRSSVALYAVSESIEGAAIAGEMRQRCHTAVCRMLLTASDGPLLNPEMAATAIHGAMSGVSRQMLEADDPRAAREPLQQALTVMLKALLAQAPRA